MKHIPGSIRNETEWENKWMAKRKLSEKILDELIMHLKLKI